MSWADGCLTQIAGESVTSCYGGELMGSRFSLDEWLEFRSVWLLEKLSLWSRRWQEANREHSTPLYHDYIEGMFAHYTDQRLVWLEQGYSQKTILIKSLPLFVEIVMGIGHLTFQRFNRGISLLIYALDELMSLSNTTDELASRSSRPVLRFLLRFLHRATGNAGNYVEKISLTLSPEARITSWNSSAQAVFGFTENEAFGSEAVGTFVPPVETGGRTLSEHLLEVCTSPEDFGLNINENQDSRKQRFWMFWVNAPIKSLTGELLGVRCIGMRIQDDELMRILVKAWKGLRKLSQKIFGRN